MARSAATRAQRRWDDELRRGTAGRRALPDFLVIGAQKAGTTSLFAYLGAHPDVVEPTMKELHFLDRDGAVGSLDDYRVAFPLERELRGGQGGGGSSGRALTGEASPSYLLDRRVPHRIAAWLPAPGPRCIAVLRDPAARAWSQYGMNRAKGVEPLSFADALRAEEERLAAWRDDPFADHLPPHDGWRWYSYAARGAYGEQLSHWCAVLGPARLLVVRSEELASAPADVFGRVLRFLGLAPFTPPAWERRNPGRGARGEEVPAPERAFLDERLADDRAVLDRLLTRHPELLGSEP
jgi:hypothetical protein